jgi:hypothetical protein
MEFDWDCSLSRVSVLLELDLEQSRSYIGKV